MVSQPTPQPIDSDHAITHTTLELTAGDSEDNNASAALMCACTKLSA